MQQYFILHFYRLNLKVVSGKTATNSINLSQKIGGIL